MENTCEGCRYFYQHYVHVKNKLYVPIQCGHYAHPRIRDKRPNTPACQRFAKK